MKHIFLLYHKWLFQMKKQEKYSLKNLHFIMYQLKKKLSIKKLNNVDLLRELPIYDGLNIVKQQKHFKNMQRVIALT